MELTLDNRTILDGYWDKLKDLSDVMKLALITRLHDSLSHGKTRKEDVELDGIVGLWGDDKYPMAEALHQMRRSSHTISDL